MGLIKFILAIGFITLIAIGTYFGGLIGFAITFIMAMIISGMFSRIEKNKTEKIRHEEMLKTIKEGKRNDNL